MWKYKNNKTGQIVESPCIDSRYWGPDWECMEVGPIGGAIYFIPSEELKINKYLAKTLKFLIEKLIKLAKRNHGDSTGWGSSCASVFKKEPCNCGAEENNKEIEKIEKGIKEILG